MAQKITHGYTELMAKAEAAVESVEKLPEKKST